MVHTWFRTHPVHHDNIVWHWDHATDEEFRRGLRWYTDAHHMAVALANGDAHLGAGVLAVYSPQQGWIANMLLAARVLHAGHGISGTGSGAFATTAQKRAADRLLAGEHYQTVLSGPKVLAFAHAIEHGGDTDPAHPQAVIDRHALSVAHGTPLTIAQYSSAPMWGISRRDGSVTHRHYDHVVARYHRAAADISRRTHQSVTAHQVQAVTWLVRQRLNESIARERGLSVLAKGREIARRNAENAWHAFRATHLPHVSDWPQTGYRTAA